jgi:plasmid replication initiation protein
MNKNLTVVKANQIIEASYCLTLSEQRILLSCIAQIDSTKELSSNIEFQVFASNIAEMATIDQSNAYRELKKAIEKLYHRSIKLNNNGGEIRWIYRKDYLDNEGKGMLCFSPEIVPYLSQLSEKFTRYKLEYVSRFKSSYSIRLYELLVQWLSKGEREIEIEWLKDIFQISHKYASIRDLKNRVIKPAIADINEHSNLWCEYGQRKTGRTITHFQFRFGLKNQTVAPTKKSTTSQQSSSVKPKTTIEQFVQENPTLTRGKTTQEVLNLMAGRR